MRRLVWAALSLLSTSMLAAEKAWEDQYYLAEAMYYEARGEGDAGLLLVAEVIEARTQQARFKSPTIKEVVHSRGYSKKAGKIICAFEYYCDGKPDSMPNEAQKKRMLSLASYFLYGGYERKLGGADHYYAHATILPYWRHDMYDIVVYKGHTFGKLDW